MTSDYRLREFVERLCSFNCDADAACECAAHQLYRAGRIHRLTQEQIDQWERQAWEADQEEIKHNGFTRVPSRTVLVDWIRKLAARYVI